MALDIDDTETIPIYVQLFLILHSEQSIACFSIRGFGRMDFFFNLYIQEMEIGYMQGVLDIEKMGGRVDGFLARYAKSFIFFSLLASVDPSLPSAVSMLSGDRTGLMQEELLSLPPPQILPRGRRMRLLLESCGWWTKVWGTGNPVPVNSGKGEHDSWTTSKVTTHGRRKESKKDCGCREGELGIIHA